ncbi:MAG: GNAT family N-acetyltransferase [Acidobacteria bacterium]|nr:GNAT family N-acetyltransferase [Acidobacteriota bacterium]
MEIRKYAPADREACLAVFDSNFADPQMRVEFAGFLDGLNEHFFVAAHGGELIGCGGFALAENAAALRWGMIHRAWQRKGAGRFLLFYRMREITKNKGVEFVRLRAPAEAADFFAKQGFRETSRDGKFVEMTKRLAVCQ